MLARATHSTGSITRSRQWAFRIHYTLVPEKVSKFVYSLHSIIIIRSFSFEKEYKCTISPLMYNGTISQYISI